MEIYLVQHAEAKSKEEDPNRSITERGRQDVLQVSEFAARMGVKAAQIRHSGKTRAEQTASLLGEVLSPSVEIQTDPRLGPLDPVEPIGDELGNAHQNVMLVGHLPFMERLAGYLLTGDAERAVVKFHNAGIVCIVHTEDDWQVDWILTPRMVQHGNTIS